MCAIDGTFVQTSNCGNVRVATGTSEDPEKCGTLEECKDENGNMVPGVDENNDGLCDDNGSGGGEGTGNDVVALGMQCSLNGRD